jgi:argininosuccinate lyase
MLSILGKVLYGLKINEARMQEASQKEFIFAADISEFLVKTKKYSSQEAHRIAGQLVLYSLKTKMPIKLMPDEELKRFAPELNTIDIDRLIDPIESVKRVKSYGGTNPKEVQRQIRIWVNRLNARI